MDSTGNNHSLTELSHALLASESIEEIAARVLESARRLTGSRHGFVGYIDPETGDLVSPTLTQDIWESCRIPDKDFRFTRFCGLWGRVLETKKPLLANRPGTHPHSTGIPEGHIPIEKFLSVPAMLGGELVGQIALANAERNYTDADLALLQRMAEFFALAVQRKRAEDLLFEKQMFNQSVLNSLSAHIAIVDANADILMTNQEWDDFALDNGAPELGGTACAGSNYLETCRKAEDSGDDLAGPALRGILDVLERKLPYFQMEYPCHSPGLSRWFLMQATPLARRKGGAVIAHIDISERKITEERLRESESRYKALFNSVNDAVFIHDLSGRFLEVNHEACHRLNYSRQELLAKTTHEIVSPDYADHIKPHIQRLLQEHQIFFESAHLTCEGDAIPVEVHSRLIDYEGRPAVFSVARDIRERKRAEKAMREAHKKLEKRVAERTAELARANDELKTEVANRVKAEQTLRVANTKMQGVLATLGAGLLIVNRQFVIEFQNGIHQQWFGDLHGQSFAAYTPAASFSELKQRCLDSDEGAAGQTCELEHVSEQGEFEQSVSLFRDEDQQEKLIVLQRNVSEKKRLEAEATRSSRLASVGELAAGVAHEINNPINGVINYAQILMDEYGETGGELGEVPARIAREAERVASIVKNLLFFARESKDELMPLHIPDILFDALELVGKQFSKNGIRLMVHYSTDLQKAVVNSQKMQQVFINLLSNARYALNQRFPEFHEDKKLIIRIYMTGKNQPNRLRIEFLDFGIGMEPEIINRICDPFFSTKPRGEGTGLGLSISYGIVRDHGGELRFESQKGVYTLAGIELPANAAPGGSPSEASGDEH